MGMNLAEAGILIAQIGAPEMIKFIPIYHTGYKAGLLIVYKNRLTNNFKNLLKST